MQKDVIYIDVDDDITTVIGKVKSASHKIVALVPPKRVGMLQSAVNLRLLNRAAEQKDKKLVLISNNQQLSALAGMTGIPVAKTLQSKPEIAPIDALDIDNGEELIDGSELPIGEHAKQSEGLRDATDSTTIAAVGAAALTTSQEVSNPMASPLSNKKPRVKNGKVPNFNKFRKRLALIVIAGILLIGTLVWAIFIAPHANVIVTMRTTDAAVSQQVTLSTTDDTSVKGSVIKAETMQLAEEVEANITPTGEKNVGDKASGSIRIYASAATILVTGLTVPAGTTVTSTSGQEYLTTQTATIQRGDADGLDGVVVDVEAAEPGEKYNGASGEANVNARGVSSAEFETTTTGGTDKKIKIATNKDIEKAEAEALEGINRETAKDELVKKFGEAYVVIQDSLQVDETGVEATVKAGEEASSENAKVAGKVVFSLYAVDKTELDGYLKSVLKQQLDDNNEQRVYSTGADEAVFTGVDKADNGITANLSTNGSTGPNVTDQTIKTLSKGKKYGEVKAVIESINGVESADVEFSGFWVRKVPTDEEKISVEFKVNGTQ